MPLMQALGTMNSYDTTRTYPVSADEVRRAVVSAMHGLPRWKARSSSEGEVTAVRRTRLGFEDDVSVSLTERKTGSHTNTHAAFGSVSRKGVYDFGQNRRNLRELLDAVDRELRSHSHS